MSSLAVRNLVLQFLDDNSAETGETVVDLTGHFENLSELLSNEGVQPDAPWLGIEFIGNGEEPVSLAATNDQGLYREEGMILLHVCAVAKIGVGQSLVERGEVLRNLFRGERIGGIVIEAVRPVNTGPGATLEFEGGYVSGTVEVEFHFDFSPTP